MATVVRRIINPSTLLKPIAPYSHGVIVDNTLYVSGQIGMDPKTGDLVKGGVAGEAKQALENLGNVLRGAGTDFDKVVKTTVLLADMKDFETVNSIYGQYFVTKYPARACFQTAGLPKGCKVEIEAIAVVANIRDVE